MAHRPLVVLVSVGTRRPPGGCYPPDGRFKESNDEVGEEIPPQLVPHHRMEWYRARPPALTGVIRRGEAGGSERQLARSGRGRPELAADVVPPAQHLVADVGGGGVGDAGSRRR